MYLTALSIGYAIPRADFDAAVHSVFKSALNLRLTSGGKLLTLVTSSEADLPQGIRVDTPDDFSFEIFHSGDDVTCREDTLRLGSLTIELRGARRWKCDLSALQAEPAKPTVSTAWSFVWDMLNKRQRLTKSEIVAEELFRSDETIQAGVPRKAGEAMRGLFDATRRFDPTVISSVRPLIGLGSGLTPRRGFGAQVWIRMSAYNLSPAWEKQ